MAYNEKLENAKITAKIIFAFMLILIGVLGPILYIDNAVSKYKCRKYEEVSGKETRWVVLDSCYVKTESGWRRWDEYIARFTAIEGLSD